LPASAHRRLGPGLPGRPVLPRRPRRVVPPDRALPIPARTALLGTGRADADGRPARATFRLRGLPILTCRGPPERLSGSGLRETRTHGIGGFRRPRSPQRPTGRPGVAGVASLRTVLVAGLARPPPRRQSSGAHRASPGRTAAHLGRSPARFGARGAGPANPTDYPRLSDTRWPRPRTVP